MLTTLNAKQLAKVLIKIVLKYYGLPNPIITDRALLFILKFWSFHYYYLHVKY